MPYTGSKAKSGRASSIAIGAVTGATAIAFVPIEEVTSSNFSGSAWGTADTTNFQSGVDEEFITTTRNNGDVDLGGNIVDGAPGQAALMAAYNSGMKYTFQVQLAPGPGETTTGTMYAFSALVKSFFDVKIDVKSAVTFTAKLQISGPITPTVGS